jgi:hypothetical protein
LFAVSYIGLIVNELTIRVLGVECWVLNYF